MATRVGGMGKVVAGLVEEKTPLQIQIGQMAKKLVWLVGIIALLIFLWGKFLGYETFQIFTTSVAVALAAVPEGLTVTLTIILSLGMQRILKGKALVRQLLATETLGSVSVICADKTGTLTEGKMRVVDFMTTDQRLETERKLMEAAILCNDMRDPLEIAMMDWAKKQLKIKNLKFKIKDYPRLDEIPFNPSDKYIATLHEIRETENEKRILFLSGAPEVVLSKCKVQSAKFKAWEKKFEEYGRKGYRLVGFAYRVISHQSSAISHQDLRNLDWLGILAYEDPVREGVKQALQECQAAGIKVKVITGDYLSTSLAVLKKLDIKDHQRVLEGEQLEKMSLGELKKIVSEIVLFARTTPEQKLKIVQALKGNNEVVAMMGDGVNDAMALKQSDIGVVVEAASDLAKESAEMVLLDSNFATVVQAVGEGRSIFENIKKATLYLLSHSFVEVIVIGSSLFFRLPLPITAAQILWINMFQDTLPAIALAFEPKEKGLMDELPRKKDAPIIDSSMKIILLFVGLIGPLFLTTLVISSLKGFLPFYFSQTLVFAALGVISMFVVLACRSLRWPFRYNLWQNPPLIWALLASLALLLLAIYWPPFQILLQTQPLGLKEWFLVITLGVLNLLAIELIKQFLFLRRSRYSIIK
jgi:Ca2+-transporting ATPase